MIDGSSFVVLIIIIVWMVVSVSDIDGRRWPTPGSVRKKGLVQSERRISLFCPSKEKAAYIIWLAHSVRQRAEVKVPPTAAAAAVS